MRSSLLGGGAGITISALGLGCWAFGGGKYWGPTDQTETSKVVHAALDEGINYFDTAEGYNDGESERSLGLSLRGRRDKAVIGTKVSPSNAAPAVLVSHCKESLKRLGTDYIDLYMLHWPLNRKSLEHFTADPASAANPPSVGEVFSALAGLQKEGLVRHVGISNHGVEQMKEAAGSGLELLANELPYNLVSRGIEKTVLPYCAEHKIGVIAYMALQQGLLADLYPALDAIPPAQAHSRHFHYLRGKDSSRHGEEGAEAEILALLGKMRPLAAELGTDIGTLALSWAMAERRIACTLVGSRSVEKLKRNSAAAEFPLTVETRELLRNWSEPVLAKLGYNPDYYENRADGRIR